MKLQCGPQKVMTMILVLILLVTKTREEKFNEISFGRRYHFLTIIINDYLLVEDP